MAKTLKKRKTVKIRKRPRNQKRASIASVIRSKWFLNLLVGLLVAGLVALAVERVWTLAMHSNVFTVVYHFPHTPEWFNDEAIRQHTKNDEFLARKHSAFESGLIDNVKARFSTIPWVRKATVSKSLPNRLNIELEYRRPVAWVLDGKWNLVDKEGACLGQEGDNPYLLDKLGKVLSIHGSKKNEKRPEPGEKWSDEAVAAGASVAEMLRPLLNGISSIEGSDPVSAIHVENFGGRKNLRYSAIVLETRKGKKIEWGHSAANTSPDEPTQEEKLAILTKLYEASPVLDEYKDKKLGNNISLRWYRDKIVTSE
ncbi:MAG: FtsQ-type POTRA domain-containing protein [Planctomycetota bacterium]